MRQHFWLLLALFWGWNPPGGFAQRPDTDHVYVDPSFISKHWTVRDGLPVNSVTEIIQSSVGYIWFGTFDGLVRFDGVRFKVYKTDEYEGMVSNRIIRLAEAADSSIFIIDTTRELVRFKDSRFEKITEQHGHNGGNTHSFFKRKNDGKLWLGTSNGLLVYEKGRFRPYYPDMVQGQIDKFHIDPDGILWYRDNVTQNIYRFDGETRTLIAQNGGTESLPLTILTAKNGSTFIATINRVFHYKNGISEQLPFDRSGTFTVTDLYENSDGSVLLSTRFNGLFKLDNGRFIKFGEYGWKEDAIPVLGLSGATFLNHGNGRWLIGSQTIFYDKKPVFSFNNRIDFSLADREGGLWLGTYNQGLFRLKANPFTTYSVEEGMPHPNIYPVLETSDGAIWTGTFGSGVTRIKNGEIEADYNSQWPPEGILVRTLLELDSGTLLAGISSKGIYSLDKTSNSFKRWSTPKNQPELARPMTIESLFQDTQKKVWAGTNHGLYMKETVRSEWQRIPDQYSHPDHTVLSITEAPDGALWMATNGDGILRYQSGTFESFTTEAGLSSDFVRYIHVDRSSSNHKSDYILWIGTGDKGLNRLEVKQQQPDFQNITIYNEEVGLYDNVVHVILPDNSGRFWMSGNRGISWVNRSDLEQFAKGQITSVKSIFYTEEDGLRNREANGGVQTPGIRAIDGSLWFPTQDGVVTIDPDQPGQDSSPVPVVIEQTTSGSEPITKQNQEYILQPEQRDFSVNYTGLNFSVSEKIDFKYRLSGYQDNWIEVQSQRTAFFTNIPAGTYRFEVLATNNHGEWNEVPAVVSIKVLPFFYETNWFRFIILFVIALSLFCVIQYRTHHLKRKKEELEKAIKERTEELESEKQKTEAQARELLELDEYKSRFFTNITHEFRTPLTLIIGPLQKLVRKNRELPREKILSEVKRALGNSRRLQRLIDQILDLSKLEAGELSLEFQVIDLVHFTRRITEMFTALIESQDLSMDFRASAETISIHADADALEKILANLLSNAIKFTPAGGSISVDLEEEQGYAILSVTDTGMGIETDELNHVFDRFYQTDSSLTRIAEGTGIGLALVKNLVELHQGKIGVESQPGEGSTFTVSFKKIKEHLKEAAVHPAPVCNTQKYYNYESTELNGNKRREKRPTKKESDQKPSVLIVEDNHDMRDFIRLTIEDHFSVFEAQDGEDALRLLKEKLPDLIISDIMMPNMDGTTLNEELKKDPMLETIPVIFLTAKASQKDILEGLRNGADDYLTKPFDADILVAKAQNIIEKRKLLRRHILEYGLDSQAEKNDSDPFLEEVYEVLRKKFADPEFGVSELADTLHIDRTGLFRKMKKSANCSPQEFLHDFRMKQAAKLLLERNESISEVAYACGFNNISYFSRAFKKTHNVSPSEFQARHLQKK